MLVSSLGLMGGGGGGGGGGKVAPTDISADWWPEQVQRTELSHLTGHRKCALCWTVLYQSL